MIINKLSSSKKISITEATVSVSSATYSKTRQYLTNLLTVTYDGQTLGSSDYTLSGTLSSVNAGTFTATMTGIGKFKGTRQISWTISKATLYPSNRVVTYDGDIVYSGATPASGNKTLITTIRNIGYGADKHEFGVDLYFSSLSSTEFNTIHCTMDVTGPQTRPTFRASYGPHYSPDYARWYMSDFLFSWAGSYVKVTFQYDTNNYEGSQVIYLYAA